jgi:hypothetical protein
VGSFDAGGLRSRRGGSQPGAGDRWYGGGRRPAHARANKVEYVHRHALRPRAEARIKTATWITNICNARRLHSVCGFKSPIDYEREYRATLAEGLAAQIVSTARGD